MDETEFDAALERAGVARRSNCDEDEEDEEDEEEVTTRRARSEASEYRKDERRSERAV